MDTETLLIVYALSAVIGLAILYEIIRTAVRAGTKRQTRAIVLWMIKNGMSSDEIKTVMEMEEKGFWKKFEKPA